MHIMDANKSALSILLYPHEYICFHLLFAICVAVGPMLVAAATLLGGGRLDGTRPSEASLQPAQLTLLASPAGGREHVAGLSRRA